jgi:hypothetical protein
MSKIWEFIKVFYLLRKLGYGNIMSDLRTAYICIKIFKIN